MSESVLQFNADYPVILNTFDEMNLTGILYGIARARRHYDSSTPDIIIVVGVTLVAEFLTAYQVAQDFIVEPSGDERSKGKLGTYTRIPVYTDTYHYDRFLPSVIRVQAKEKIS